MRVDSETRPLLLKKGPHPVINMTLAQLNFYRFLTLKLNIHSDPPEGLFSPIAGPKLKEIISDFKAGINNNQAHQIGLYLNVPFCVAKCSYCDVSAGLSKEEIPLHYELILAEINKFSSYFKGVNFEDLTLYGGRFLAFLPAMLENMLRSISNKFSFKSEDHKCEIIPFLATRLKLEILKKYGVNYAALGIESLDKDVLKSINRPQDEAMVLKVIDLLRQLKFKGIRLDLIAGLPNQSIESLLRDLKKIISVKPEWICIFPFVPFFGQRKFISSLQANPERKISLTNFIKKRDVMIKEARSLLADSGYVNKGALTFINKRAMPSLPQFSARKDRRTSKLCLGPGAASHLNGEFIFSTGVSKKSACYSGIRLNQQMEIAGFLEKNLLKGFTSDVFYKLFKNKFSKLFSSETKCLEGNILKQKGGRVQYKSISGKEDFFDYYAHVKLFYDKEYQHNLRRYFIREFNPDFDYTFSNYGYLKDFTDLDFVMEKYSYFGSKKEAR